MKNIIHFTDQFSKVNSILNTSSLRLTYCQEVFCLGKEKVSSAAHPMVCFSEFDIDDLVKKTISYGRYGIVFSNEWVVKNKIHPILYIEKESTVASALAKLLKARQNSEVSDLPNDLRLPIMTIKCFTKNTVGENSFLGQKDFNFREECEWRFVPEKKDIDYELISMNKSTYLLNKDLYNNKLKPFPLLFEYNDIEKIFVTTELELNTISSAYNIDKKKILMSKWNYNKTE